MVLILGAGLAGMSCSYHLGHDCLVVEKKPHAGGHIYSHVVNGFTWDEGPHVSFTKHKYVKDLFARSTKDEFLEYSVYPSNYYKGNWIPHPAQSNLYAVPEPIRSKCLNDFLNSRNEQDLTQIPHDYEQWSKMAFGEAFYVEFIKSYTEKYWTVNPKLLTTDWVGGRVFYPDIETVKKGFHSAPDQSTHYITSVRYPENGGYYKFAQLLQENMNVLFNKTVDRISLDSKTVYFTDGSSQEYTTLINTLPLPEFIKFISPPADISNAATDLACSELLLLNYVVNHSSKSKAHWLYVYDLDKYATRINFTEMLSPNNGLEGKSGIQVEVYFSKYRQQKESLSEITRKVFKELIDMGLVENENCLEDVHTQYIKYANVICDHSRKKSLDKIFDYLAKYGLKREVDDLEPMNNWDTLFNEKTDVKMGELVLAGRFGQWKYYWTDDCVMRGKYISETLCDEHKY